MIYLNISGIGQDGSYIQRNEPVKQEVVKAETPVPHSGDEVSISGKSGSWEPKVIVGIPTGRLAPLIDMPNVHPSPIAIELDRGIGIGIDGESIIISPYPRSETIEIKGRLEDGTYPQRDYKAVRDGAGKTVVDGYYDWQDAEMNQEGKTTLIKGETNRESFKVTEEPDNIKVEGDYAVQNYNIAKGGKETNVDGWDTIYDAKITQQDNTLQIKGDFPERDFTITKEGNKFKVDGHYAFQDFEITVNNDSIIVEGCYPHQKHVITRNPS